MENIKYTHKFNNLNDAIAHINRTESTHAEYANRFEQIQNATFNYNTHLEKLKQIEADTESGVIECFYIIPKFENVYYGDENSYDSKYEEIETIFVKRKYDINVLRQLNTLGGGSLTNQDFKVYNDFGDGQFTFLGCLKKSNREEFKKVLSVYENAVVA